jgi:hypothetical protein
MTTKELRIGNLLNYCGQIVYVMGIYPDNKVELGYFADSIGFTRSIDDKDLKPIELTEETFIKFFFKWKNHALRKGSICIRSYGGDWAIFLSNESFNFKIDLKYAHNFQNLYHSLTGEELTPITP